MADLNEKTGVLERGEEWFLAELDRPQINTRELLASLSALAEAGQIDQAESRAELLQDTLTQKGQINEALDVLQWRAARAQERQGSTQSWKQEALDVVGASWEQKNLVEQCGFDQGIPVRESIRRLHLLRGMHPGVLCHDKTWGLGVISSVDYFYQRVEVDFERKLGHQLSMAYAAETLELVADDHLLVWKHRRREDLRQLLARDPAEVVRMAIRSFGPMTMGQLQQRLVPGIVSEADWKRFWEAARRALKTDPVVDLPANRSGLLRFRQADSSHEQEFFTALSTERDLARIVDLLEDLADRAASVRLTEAQQRLVEERIQFVARGVTEKQRGILARARVAAQRLGVSWRSNGNHAAAGDLFDSKHFTETLRQLPAKGIRSYLRHMAALDGTRTQSLLVGHLPDFEMSAFNEAMGFLLESGAETACAAVFKSGADNRQFSVEMLLWLARNIGYVETWSLGSVGMLLNCMVDALESDCRGERLKAQNQLRERIGKPEWLCDILGRLDDSQRRQFLTRVKDSKGWTSLDRQSLMGQMIKLYPELADITASRPSRAAPPVRGPLTSHRSFKERQAQLEKIINVEIPRVARDIGIARSYGDLRENFEFKAAKEAQAILFRRRDELTEMLHRVTPTNFQDFPTDRAGMATTVELAYPDGRRERYHILGEWDGDTALGIISNTSRMAMALEGRRAGERVTVPSERGEVVAEIVSVKGLPQEIRDWVEGR